MSHSFLSLKKLFLGIVTGRKPSRHGSLILAEHLEKESENFLEPSVLSLYHEKMLNILLIILGMAMLIKASDMMVDGVSALARQLKVSELIIAIAIAGFGTSAPELTVSLYAAISGYSNIALGNVIGGNIFNLLGILGIIGLIVPITGGNIVARNNILFLLLASIMLIVLPNTGLFGKPGMLGRGDGMVFLTVFALFLFCIYKNMKTETVTEKHTGPAFPLWKSALFIVFGIAALLIGGNIVVSAAVSMVQTWGVCDKLIALTIIAFGTSLPELMVSAAAVLKKKNDIAVGNIIGTNIFNILFILGLGSLVRPIAYAQEFNIDISVLIFGVLLLLWTMFVSRHKKLTRPVAIIFILLYIVYIIYILNR